MGKLNVSDLEKIRQRVRKTTTVREGAGRAKITVHMGTCGIAAGAREIMKTVLEEIGKSQAEDIIVTSSGCAGLCSREPMMTVEIKDEAPVKYGDLTPEKAAKIFRQHAIEGSVVTDLALGLGSERQS